MKNETLYDNGRVKIVEDSPGYLGIWIASGVFNNGKAGEICIAGQGEIQFIIDALTKYKQENYG